MIVELPQWRCKFQVGQNIVEGERTPAVEDFSSLDAVSYVVMFPPKKIDYNLIINNAERTLYELMDGAKGLRALVNRFYDLMDSSPEAEKIRAFHAKSLNQSREKLFMFLPGWSGGPQLYVERFGHPRLRMRHMPFSIGAVERDQWLWCMNKALEESQIDPRVVDYLKARFAEVADAMRNQVEN